MRVQLVSLSILSRKALTRHLLLRVEKKLMKLYFSVNPIIQLKHNIDICGGMMSQRWEKSGPAESGVRSKKQNKLDLTLVICWFP